MKRHNIHKHSDHATFKCNTCKRTFYNEKKFKEHGNCTSEKVKKYLCPLCLILLKSPLKLKEHQMRHAKKKPHACNICPRSFTHRLTLKKHMVTHSREKQYKCDFCEKSFTHQNRFKEHIRIHTLVRSLSIACTVMLVFD